MPLCGGLGSEKPADDTVHSIVKQVKTQVEGALGKTLEQFKPISYKTQVVAGVNYFVKVRTGTNETDHLILRIYKDLQGNVTYHSHKETTEQAEIAYI